MTTIEVRSSHGMLTIDAISGKVIRLQDLDPKEQHYLHDIDRFDMHEYNNYYPGNTDKFIDILDLGYWLKDGTYGGPEQGWRDEVKQMREGK